jgi:predicted short-subunit dehydrogenase-like oxidoreductase (DUF2520 family)
MNTFSIVGTGRVGTALGRALAAKGWSPRALCDRDLKAARESRRLIGGGAATADLRRAARSGDVVIIAVPDGAVAPVAAELARAVGRWDKRVVLHTSGILPARVLGPLKKKGAAVASAHPAQTFPEKGAGPGHFKGIFWGLEGDEQALRAALGIVRSLRGRALLLAEEDKPLYHAACSLASNAFISLEVTAARLLAEAGIAESWAAAVLFPLVQGTLQNVKNLGWGKALTGPVARGDAGAVRKHLETLGAYPEILAVYRALARQALAGLPEGRLSKAEFKRMERLLGGG